MRPHIDAYENTDGSKFNEYKTQRQQSDQYRLTTLYVSKENIDANKRCRHRETQ